MDYDEDVLIAVDEIEDIKFQMGKTIGLWIKFTKGVYLGKKRYLGDDPDEENLNYNIVALNEMISEL